MLDPFPGKPIRALLNAKRAQGYSKNSVRLMKAVLSSVLTDAAEDEIIEVNPALHLGKKKKRRAGNVTKADSQKNIRPMDWNELDAFRTEAARPVYRPYGALVNVLALAGLRPSEALALQPGDVDFRKKILRVERALSLDGRLKGTKTNEVRTVDLNEDLLQVLKAHLTWLKEETLRRGWGQARWLFPSHANTPPDHNNVAKIFHRILKKAELPHFRVYDLRHTFGSLLLSANAPSST